MEKPGVDPSKHMRIMHDRSFPNNLAVNDHTDKDLVPSAHYDTPADMARKINRLNDQYPSIPIKRMSGVPFHENEVHMFCARIPELNALIIDLSQGFGWTGAPGFYGLAGQLINSLYESQRPIWTAQPRPFAHSFDGNVWCDDHNSIEPDVGSRLAESNLALRTTAMMVTVLGPRRY